MKCVDPPWPVKMELRHEYFEQIYCFQLCAIAAPYLKPPVPRLFAHHCCTFPSPSVRVSYTFHTPFVHVPYTFHFCAHLEYKPLNHNASHTRNAVFSAKTYTFLQGKITSPSSAPIPKTQHSPLPSPIPPPAKCRLSFRKYLQRPTSTN